MLVCALCRPSRSPAFPLAVAGASSGRQSRRAAPPPPWAPGRFCLPSLPPGLGCGPGRGCRGREGAGVWGRWVAGRALFASGVHAARPERTRRPRGPSRFTSGFRAHAPPLMRVAWPFRRPVRPPLAALCGPSRAPYLLGAPRVGPARARSFAHPPPVGSGARARPFPPRGLCPGLPRPPRARARPKTPPSCPEGRGSSAAPFVPARRPGEAPRARCSGRDGGGAVGDPSNSRCAEVPEASTNLGRGRAWRPGLFSGKGTERGEVGYLVCEF